MDVIKLSQTPIVPGRSTTVSIFTLDRNGKSIIGQFDAPAGKDAVLPENMATTDDVAQMIGGTRLQSQTDVRGLGLILDGETGQPRFLYGDPKSPRSSLLLGADSNGSYTIVSMASVEQFVSTPILRMAFGSTSNASAQFCQIVDGSTQHIINVTDSSGGSASWGFRTSDGTVATPSGNRLLETFDKTGPRLRQYLTVAVTDGQLVSWPQILKNDQNVQAKILVHKPDGHDHAVVNVSSNPGKFNVFVTVRVWDGTKYVAPSSPVTIDLEVEGYI